MKKIAKYATEQSGRDIPEGDGDPLDICVLTEKEIPHGNIILQAIPIGGIRLIDKGEADDKIIAVLKNDALYGNWKDIADCPKSVLNRLVHYFLTYKNIPGEEKAVIEIESVYGRDIAHEVIRKSRQDYRSLTAVPTI